MWPTIRSTCLRTLPIAVLPRETVAVPVLAVVAVCVAIADTRCALSAICCDVTSSSRIVVAISLIAVACSLAPLACWFARAYAVAEGRAQIDAACVTRALMIVDHQHGITPLLNLPSERSRMALLCERNTLRSLVIWYGS